MAIQLVPTRSGHAILLYHLLIVGLPKGGDNKWRKGEDVHIVEVNGEQYIRTDSNSKESDNLENLPEF
ncbi:MAG: DUF3892 domain-containing protein [Bacteroidota bacterium]